MPVEDNGLSAKDSGHGISLADKRGRVRSGFFLSESGSANVVLAGPDGRRRTPISDSRMTFDDSTGHKADAFKGVLTSGMRRRIFLRRRLEMPNAKNVNQTDSTREDGYLSEDSVQDHEAGLYPEAGRPQHILTLDAIDDEAVARFHEQGYLVVDRALDEETPDPPEEESRSEWDARWRSPAVASPMPDHGLRRTCAHVIVWKKRFTSRCLAARLLPS